MSVHQHCRGNLQCWINDSSLKGFINHWDLRAVLGPALVLSDLSIRAIFILLTLYMFMLCPFWCVHLLTEEEKYEMTNKEINWTNIRFSQFLCPQPPPESSLARLGLLGTLETRQNMFFHRGSPKRFHQWSPSYTPASQPGHHIYPPTNALPKMLTQKFHTTRMIFKIQSKTKPNKCTWTKRCLLIDTGKKSGWDKLLRFCRETKKKLVKSSDAFACIKELSVLSIEQQTRNYLSWSASRSL